MHWKRNLDDSEHNCPNCGSSDTYEDEMDSLLCADCGYSEGVERIDEDESDG